MGINVFLRTMNIISGKANAAMDGLETPEDKLRLFVKNLDEELNKLRQAVALAIAEEKKINAQIREELLKAAEWEKRAVHVLKTGNEELAREALLKKSQCDELAASLKKDWETQSAAVAKLKLSLAKTRSKAEKAKREYSIMLARYSTAKAQKSIGKQLSGSSNSQTHATMDDLNRRIMNIEAEVEAELELCTTEPDVDAQFEAVDIQVRGDEALEKLKAKLLKS